MYYKNIFFRPSILCTATFILASLAGCSNSSPRVIRTVPCGDGSNIVLTMHEEFVEAGMKKVWHLAFKSQKRDLRRMTGTVGTLPEVTRYSRRITERIVNPAGSISMFGRHYMSPSTFTRDEFNSAATCYARHISAFPELKNSVRSFVWGDQHDFNEFFACSGGLHVFTQPNGLLMVSTHGTRASLSLPPGKRRLDAIGKFDDRRLVIWKGRIAGPAGPDVLGRLTRPIEISDSGKLTIRRTDTLWAEKLYGKAAPAFDSTFLKSCRGPSGHLTDVFDIIYE